MKLRAGKGLGRHWKTRNSPSSSEATSRAEDWAFTRKLHYGSGNAGSGLINNLATDASRLVSVLLHAGGNPVFPVSQLVALFAGWSIRGC